MGIGLREPSTLSERQLLIKDLKKNIISLGQIILHDNIVFENPILSCRK